jgi:hypothetical protein
MFRGYWFRKTTLPLAVPSATWFSFAGRAGYVKQPVHPLFEFRSPSESCPTRPSLPAETDKHLSWALLPYSTRRLGDPLATELAVRPLRSALRVWLPSRRLTPSEPRPVLFHTGGAHGIRPAELSPLGRYPLRFRSGKTHVPFNLSVIPPPRKAMGRPNRPRFLGFDPFESPLRQAGV